MSFPRRSSPVNEERSAVRAPASSDRQVAAYPDVDERGVGPQLGADAPRADLGARHRVGLDERPGGGSGRATRSRVGSRLIVTLPLEAVRVVGKTGTRMDFGVAGACALSAVALPADEQPARTAAAATAARTAAGSRWGVLIVCFFLRYKRGGRRDRRPAGSGGSRRTGRSALPTRVDVVRRGLSRPGLDPAGAGSSQLRDSAGMAVAGFTGFAPWRAISLQADDRPG